MASRKTTTIEKLETALAALRSRHSTLNERKAEAQSAFDQAKADQERFFVEADINDNGTITRLESALGAATLRLSSLGDACVAVETQIADAEQKIAAETKREERKAAAEEITAKANALHEGLESLLREIRGVGESFAAFEHLTIETFRFAHFLRNLAGEIEAALGVMPPQLRGLAAAVARGEAQIPRRPRPAAKTG
jgi:chromosome segregation ATPase